MPVIILLVLAISLSPTLTFLTNATLVNLPLKIYSNEMTPTSIFKHCRDVDADVDADADVEM